MVEGIELSRKKSRSSPDCIKIEEKVATKQDILIRKNKMI